MQKQWRRQSPLRMAGHRQVISRISKGSQNILIYNCIITTFDCQGDSQGGGISASAFAPGTLWCGAATAQKEFNMKFAVIITSNFTRIRYETYRATYKKFRYEWSSCYMFWPILSRCIAARGVARLNFKRRQLLATSRCSALTFSGSRAFRNSVGLL